MSNANYAEATVLGMTAEPPRTERDVSREMLEVELSRVAAQWQERMGWRAKFRVESVFITGLSMGYHIKVERIVPWWHLADVCDIARYLGLISFHPLVGSGTWSCSADVLLNHDSIQQSLEHLLASREVGKVLASVFGTKCLGKKCSMRKQSDLGPAWFRARNGYQSRIGNFFFILWWYVVWFKQEICWRILGRTHIRKW